jgi:formylglycine-generating enzyme required for sulfatase activity
MPQHTIEIPYDYWMARYPVTNDQFVSFINETNYVTIAEENPLTPEVREFVKGFDWQHPLSLESVLKDKGNHPVVQVSWYDAHEYCGWLNEKLRDKLGDLALRLPTEAEWEKAARGEYGNEWPWGNEFDPKKCNSSEDKRDGTTPVGAYSPQGDSPYGVADMIGNVWEWCHSRYQPYPIKSDKAYEDESEFDARVFRGGSFYNDQRLARCAYRKNDLPGYRNNNLGFRVVISFGF